MDRPLTDKQRSVLEFLREFARSRSFAPTAREVAARFGIAEKNAFYYMELLERKGYIRRHRKSPRRIEFLGEAGAGPGARREPPGGDRARRGGAALRSVSGRGGGSLLPPREGGQHGGGPHLRGGLRPRPGAGDRRGRGDRGRRGRGGGHGQAAPPPR